MKKVLFLGLAFVLLLSGCSFAGGDKSVGSDVLTPDEAKAEAKDFINNRLLAQSDQKVGIKSISEESNLYKFEVEVKGQKIESYMTKDGKMFFPQAQDMENPEKNRPSNSAGSTSTPNTQGQQMSMQQRVESVVSQSKTLLDKLGDEVDKETRQQMEQKIKELEELNSSENADKKKLTNKIIEIQRLAQPLIQQMSGQASEQSGGGVQVNPKK